MKGFQSQWVSAFVNMSDCQLIRKELASSLLCKHSALARIILRPDSDMNNSSAIISTFPQMVLLPNNILSAQDEICRFKHNIHGMQSVPRCSPPKSLTYFFGNTDPKRPKQRPFWHAIKERPIIFLSETHSHFTVMDQPHTPDTDNFSSRLFTNIIKVASNIPFVSSLVQRTSKPTHRMAPYSVANKPNLSHVSENGLSTTHSSSSFLSRPSSRSSSISSFSRSQSPPGRAQSAHSGQRPPQSIHLHQPIFISTAAAEQQDENHNDGMTSDSRLERLED